MYKLILSTLMLLTVALAATQTIADGKYKEVIIKTAIYCDHCSACSDCEPKIEMAANAVKGVKSSELNIEAQTIKVIYNPEKTDETIIRSAIANAGYTADDLQPNPDAYAKLDGCCKKKG